MRWERHRCIDDTKQWLSYEEASIDSVHIFNWGYVLKETGELIGSGGFVYSEEKNMYELGYNIMKKYWNMGLATEAAQKIIEFGKQELRQIAFYCCHAKDNPASGRVMCKVGFQYQNDGVYYSWNMERKFETKEYLLLID